jgi:predicted phage-related endonuclease
MAAVLGFDQWRTPDDVYWSKVEEVPDGEIGDAAQLGNILEPALVQYAGTLFDVEVEPSVTVVSTEDDVFAANLDGRFVRNGGVEIVEAKTTGLFRRAPEYDEWGATETDEVPRKVLLQTQHQMYCQESEVVHVLALIGGRGLLQFRVERNDRLIKAMVEKGREFWAHHVIAKKPPAENPPPLDLLKLTKRNRTTVTVHASFIEDYKAAAALEKEAKAKRDEAKRALLAVMGDADEARDEQGRRFRYQHVEGVRLDTKRIKEEAPDIYTAYSVDASRMQSFFVDKS